MFTFQASKSALLGALVTLSLATTACGQQSPKQTTPAATPAKLVGYTTATLPIEGMSCGSCVSNVKHTLKGLDGISTVAVSLEQRTATVAYDPQKVKSEQIQAAVNAKGYKAGALIAVKSK